MMNFTVALWRLAEKQIRRGEVSNATDLLRMAAKSGAAVAFTLAWK
jgi:hypothetical protein